ncbi:amino acid racemase [Phenylobacterium sp. J426]|uniref:aspartate/glutamate racemase family protein n=1 Tax=Phenylobacterium sp. J426 TaxID=2898439 RepID=UPI0021514CE2|nr:amino acid racemase [Phenylobacterium sp. J426]MCR5874609.1 amino acid racemase [Phenylobacterium sp. J426]
MIEDAADALTLGVLGGMGPAATLEFLARLQAYTPGNATRTTSGCWPTSIRASLTGTPPGSNAGAVLAEMAGALRGAGAEVLAMPCNTAHAHADLIQRASGLPLIDMIDLGAEAAQESGALRAGVLGTKGALKLYREYLAARGMGLVSLPPERQEAFMEALYRIKSGDDGDDVKRIMKGFADELVKAGAEVLVAGCTEVPLVLDPEDVRVELVDPGDLLARRCVAVCLGFEPAPQVGG